MNLYLDEDLFNSVLEQMKNDEQSYPIWQVILSDDMLCPVLRTERIEIYYRGVMAFSLTKDEITRNTCEFENELYVYHVPEVINKEEFMKYLPYMKQNIDLWMGARKNMLYKNEFTQMIMRENNSEKAGNLSDYFIVDMKHQYETGGATADLTGLIMERSKRVNPVFRMSLIEVTYLNSAFAGRFGLRSRIADYVQLINNPELLNSVKQNTKQMFWQRKKLGLLRGIRNKYDGIDISGERPELLFALISRSTDSGWDNGESETESLKTVFEKSLEEYGDLLDDVYVAGTAELGFGLYADRKTKLKDFCRQVL